MTDTSSPAVQIVRSMLTVLARNPTIDNEWLAGKLYKFAIDAGLTADDVGCETELRKLGVL